MSATGQDFDPFVDDFGYERRGVTCPTCGGELSATAFNEATVYSGECGYREAWHRAACDDNPQVTPCRVGASGPKVDE